MIILTIHSPVRALFDYCKIAIANNFSNFVFLKKSRWFRAPVSIHACKTRINAKSKENVQMILIYAVYVVDELVTKQLSLY